MRAGAIVLGLLGSGFAWGCVSIRMGKPIDFEVVRSFEVGKTTKAEVIAKLGKPFTATMTAGGGEVWTYMYSESHARASPAAFIPVVGLMAMDTKTSGMTQMTQLTFSGDVLASVGSPDLSAITAQATARSDHP